MKQYLKLLNSVMERGLDSEDRTGVGTRSVFGRHLRFDLNHGFPIVTTKKVHWKSVVYELLWFIRGDTSLKYLHDNGVTIWDEWADENGNLGPIYGAQWRRFGSGLFRQEKVKAENADGLVYGYKYQYRHAVVDQLANVITEIIKNPTSRRLVVSAWNPIDIPEMALPPCHCLFQFYVRDGKLSCQLYQRSCDSFLGLPFNIASYALLTHIIAKITNLSVGEFVWSGGDVHIYKNHFEQVKEQLSRIPRKRPMLRMKNFHSLAEVKDATIDDFELVGYNPYPAIKAPIAV